MPHFGKEDATWRPRSGSRRDASIRGRAATRDADEEEGAGGDRSDDLTPSPGKLTHTVVVGCCKVAVVNCRGCLGVPPALRRRRPRAVAIVLER